MANPFRLGRAMEPGFFEALVDELSKVWWLDGLPEWIPCTDSDILHDLPTMSERRRWLRKAKAEITRRKIQDRVDEIAEAHESDELLPVSWTASQADPTLRSNSTGLK